MVEKGVATPILEEGHVALPAVSIKEVTPRPKKRRMGDKGKEKVRASVWVDVRMALARTHEVITPEELKEIFGVPSHEMVRRHVHKLV